MAVQDVIDSLNALDLDKLREEAMADVRSGKKTRRQAAVKKLRAIEGLKRSGVTPQDLLVKRVPVIPAAFRPYSAAGDTFIPGDANELYSDLHKAVQVHKETVAELGEEGSEDSASYLRSAVNAVYGYDDSPNPKIRNRRVSGFLTKILGSNPKVSWVQSKLLAKPQDFVGRGVITPNPDLGMDEVAIPKDMAWTLADPHLQKALVAQGIPTSRAMLMIRERHPTAQKVLEQVMRDIPVIYSRSPAWHAQNVISGYARIADGDNIEVSPLTTAGYSGDFDGDCKSMNEKDLWSIDGVIYFDTFARLVKLLNPEFPVTESSLHPIAEGRLKVVSFLEGRPVWLPVSHVHFHTKHGESVRVNLRSGFSLVTTDDHGLMTYDENLDLVQVSPAAISGGLVPVAAFLPVAVTVSEVEIAGEKQPLDYAFGYCIGHYLGDGGAYDSTSHVRLTSDDAGHLANMKDMLQWLNLAPILTNEKHKGFRILNDGFWDWFREQFDSGSFNKRIPAWVFSSPEVFRRGILDGAISTDGRVHACEKHAACNIGMENLDLIESLAVLCRTLGVWCGMGGIESGHYKLILDPEDLGWLTLTHPGRNEELKKLRLLRDSKRRQYKKVIPWNRTVSTMCLAALGLGLTVARTRFALFASSYTKKGFVSLVEAQRLSAALPSTGLPELLAKWVALVASKDSWGEVVTSVEIIEREPVTFDVTVPGPHLTVCPVQGLVTHQTMSVHFPAMPESIKDAREKLLPSIQAFSVRNRDEVLQAPKHEALLGLSGSQLAPSGTVHRVASREEALAGITSGKIKLQDQVEIGPDPMQGLGSQILGSVSAS
jgi:intein/homing endonuclease